MNQFRAKSLATGTPKKKVALRTDPSLPALPCPVVRMTYPPSPPVLQTTQSHVVGILNTGCKSTVLSIGPTSIPWQDFTTIYDKTVPAYKTKDSTPSPPIAGHLWYRMYLDIIRSRRMRNIQTCITKSVLWDYYVNISA